MPKRLTAAQVAAMQRAPKGLKRVGHTGGGFADRRTIYQKPDGSLVDDRGLMVLKAVPAVAKRPRTRAAKGQATSVSPKSFYGLPAVAEHRFHPVRMWRFDWAFPEAKLALEVEGGQWVNGRHNRAAGQIADLAKYSEAAILGWRIVYATPAEVENGTALDRVLRALKVAPAPCVRASTFLTIPE